MQELNEGEVREAGTLYQGQVAATLLKLLGLDPADFGQGALRRSGRHTGGAMSNARRKPRYET